MATHNARTNPATVHGDDHLHGRMEVRAHERTFDGFIKWMVWSVVASIALLIFLALANA